MPVSRLFLLRDNHDQALAHTERAYQLNPYDSDMFRNYGSTLMWSEHADEALDKLERSIVINPDALAYYKTTLSFAYLLVGR